MLQSIREKATGPLAWAIVAIISVPFAFFGIEAFQSGGGSSYAAKVNGEEISRYELENRVEARYARFREMLGSSFQPEMFNRAQLRGGVLEELIQEVLVRQYLGDSKHRISDSRVLEFIASQEGFLDADGNFSPELYRDSLARQGSNVEAYENRIREFLTASQFEQSIQSGSVVTPLEVESEWAWQQQERKVRWRTYARAATLKGIEVDENAIAARYEERKSSLMTPERVRVSFIELNPTVLAAEVAVSDAEVEAAYNADIERYRSPETRNARHILLKEQEQANEVHARLLEGEDFAGLAKEFSTDPGSAAAGGDLGPVSRGVMVPPFEEALFALTENEISEPVESQFGWHIIQATKITGGEVQPLEEVRAQIVAGIQQKAARAKIADLQDQLEQVAFENPSSLEPAAAAIGMEIQQSDWFTRQGGAGLSSNRSFIDAAFADAVLNAGENSPLLSVQGSTVVLRLAEHEIARQQTLEEVRDEITQQLKEAEATRLLKTRAEADQEKLQADSESWAALEEGEGVSVAEGAYLRNDRASHREIISAAFNLESAGDSQVVEMNNGDVALLQVTEVKNGAWSEASDSQKQVLTQRMQQQSASAEMQAFMAALRAEADIVYARAQTDETATN